MVRCTNSFIQFIIFILFLGVLVIKDAGTCILKDMQAKEIGKCMSYSQKDLAVLREGNTLSFSGKEIEVRSEHCIIAVECNLQHAPLRVDSGGDYNGELREWLYFP